MDGQGNEPEAHNPTAENEQLAVAAETETENSTGGGDNPKEDGLIEKAHKLMEHITTGANNPNPTVLHALSHLLESQESLFIKENGFYSNGRGSHTSGKLCKLIKENDEFFELVSSTFLSENTYSTAVKAASARLLMNWLLTWTHPYVFDDAVTENFKKWVLEEAVKFPGEHSGSSEASDSEMLKTYSTGLLAHSLMSRGQLVEDVLTSGLSAKLMHYLRVRVIGEASTSRRDAVHATETKHVSLKTKEEGRSRVRRVVDTVEGDHVLEADSGREVGQSDVLSEGESEIDGRERCNVAPVVDSKLKPGDDNTGRDDPSRNRPNRSKSRVRGKVNEGASDADVLLASPRTGRLGVRDRDLTKNLDVRNAEDVTICPGKMKSGIMEIEREKNDECFQDCVIGTKNITDLVKRAVGAAETEARAANAPDEAVKAVGDAAAELVKTAALEEFKSSGSEEAAVAAALRAATTVIDAAEVSRNPTCVTSDQAAGMSSVETDAIADLGEVSLPDIGSLAQLQEKYCIQCLEILGEYVEVLGPVLHEKGVDVCITLLERTSQLGDSFTLSPLLPDVMKLICALAAHRKFAAMFVDRGGLQKLLAVPRVTETFYGLSSCLYTIGSLQGIMERVCALPSDLIHQVVKLAIELLDCSQDQARKNSALFFAAAFVFRAILDAFDAHNSLQKLLAILKDAASVRTGGNSDRSAPEVMTSSEKQMAFHTCFALRQYFRAHLLLLVESIRPSRSGRGGVPKVPNIRAAHKPLDISNEAVDAVFLQLQKDRKLGPTFVRTQWPAVNNFLASSGHVTMLELCQTPPVDRYLHDLLQYAFGVLHIVTSIPDGRKAIVNATLSNNRAGIAVILDATNISNSIVDPEIIQPALNVLINLVCPPPSLSNKPPLAQQPVPDQATTRPSTDVPADTQSTGNAPPTPVAPASSGLVGDRRIFLGAGTGSAGLAAKLEQVYRLAREAVRGNDGIKILLKLLQPRIYVNPPATPDCLRALACRVLLGLARDDTIAQILTKLEVGKSLSELIRDSGGQSSGTDQVRWQAELTQVALELIGIVTNSGHSNTLTASDAATPTLRRIERAAIAAATPITYDSKELLLLIHEHLQASGLGETASALLKEAQLSPLPSLAPPSSIAYSATQEMSAPVAQEQWPSGRANGGFFTGKPKVCAHDEDPNSRCNAALSAKNKHLASSTQETSTPVAQQQWPSGRANSGFFPSKPKVNAQEEDPSAKKKQLTFSPSFSSQSRKQSLSQDTRAQSTQTIDSSSNSDPACADTSEAAAEIILKNDLDADAQFKTPIFRRKRKLSELRETELSVSGKRINMGELGPRTPACPTTASLRRNSAIADASGFQTPASALDVNQSGSSRLGQITPASQLRLPSDPQPSNPERLSLDSLVVQYLKHQHRQCRAPITTLPPVSLLHPHVCPEPKRLLEAPLNITGRLGTRELQSYYTGVHGNRRDRQFVFSRFKSWRSYRDETALFTSISLLGGTNKLAVGSHAGEIKIFDAGSCNMLESVSGHQAPVTLVQSYVSGDTQLLLSSSYSDVQLWDASYITGGSKHSFDGCKAAKFSNSGSLIGALSCEGSTKDVLLYDVETGSLSHKFTDPDTSSRSSPYSLVHFNPCDSLILWNGHLWDRRIPNSCKRFDQFTDYGGGGFHPSRNEVIINSEVWDLRKMNMRLLRSVPSLDQTAITFNSRGDVIYAMLRRNIEDVMSAVNTRRAKHPLFAAFRTLDAVNYSDIATIPVDRCLLDFATEPTDSFLGLITMEDQEDMFSSARMYEIGRRRPTDDDSDPDDDGETEDEDEDDEDDEDDLDRILGLAGDDSDSGDDDMSSDDNEDNSASDFDDDDGGMFFDGGGIMEIVSDGDDEDDNGDGEDSDDDGDSMSSGEEDFMDSIHPF